MFSMFVEPSAAQTFSPSSWAAQAIRRSGVRLRGDVLIASVQGEEDGGLGTFALLDRGWSADACVIPEPTDLDLVPANAGALTFRYHRHRTEGRTGDSADVDRAVEDVADHEAVRDRDE